MTPLQEMVLLGEIALQAKISLSAGNRLKACYSESDYLGIWSSIQSILISSGNVSKILWPTRKKNQLRGEQLRNLLDIRESSILNDRTFRNHFEHYDERIDSLFEDEPPVALMDLAMNPSLSKKNPKKVERGYNSFNNSILFRGEILLLDELFRELKLILDKCPPLPSSFKSKS